MSIKTVLDRTIRGIRDTIPSGFILGRTASDDGPVQLIPLRELARQLKNGSLGDLGGGGSVSPANPTATATDTAVNGTATTYMRSDAAPAVRVATNTLYGLVKMDSAFLDTAVGNVAGGIACRGASVWGQLPTGSAGQILQSNGTGLNPSWVGSSAVTSTIDTTIDDMLFGDGSDGDLTISSGTTLLTRDMCYNNVTISGTASIDVRGWRLQIRGILDLTNAPAKAIKFDSSSGIDGRNASSLAAGSGGSLALANSIGGSAGDAGGAGGSGGTTTGSQAASVANVLSSSAFAGNVAGSGGKGGNGTSGNGGASRASTFTLNTSIRASINRLAFDVSHYQTHSLLFYVGGVGAPGGSGGGGDSGTGGHAGGGGAGGGVLNIFARTIARAGTTAAGAIAAKGGDGGTGFTPTAGNRGGGGGGGGGGGLVYLVYRFLTGSTATNAVSAAGGAGGAAGNGFGTGTGGDGGAPGGGGRIWSYNLSTSTLTSMTYESSPPSGNAGSGITGGAAKAATVWAISL